MADSAQLLVVSNRGPVSIAAGVGGADEVRRGGGGLVSGMQVALAASPNALWICAAMNDRERALARAANASPLSGGHLVDADLAGDALPDDYDLLMLPIDAATYRQAYNDIANATLWFVLHMLFEPSRRPLFDRQWRRQWRAYERYNEHFAAAVAEHAAGGATVMVQDYHLFLLPSLLRQRRPDLKISLFTHTSWVGPDYFRMLPDDIAEQIVTGMLGADLLGFHTQRWASLFDDCCLDVLGHPAPARVEVFSLTTDAEELRAQAHAADVEVALRWLRDVVGDRQVIARVDRTELSKNVLRGLLAYRELLRRWPQWRGEVVQTVFDYPSREELPEYREYTAAIERLGREIDEEFSTDTWSPLLLSVEEDYPAALASLRRSDVVLINSLRDGMNLVVFEAISIADNDPVVVLSREAGAAELLGDDAIQVNPFDVSATAEALHAALSMPRDDRRAAAAERMRRQAGCSPPAQWFQAQLDALGYRP